MPTAVYWRRSGSQAELLELAFTRGRGRTEVPDQTEMWSGCLLGGRSGSQLELLEMLSLLEGKRISDRDAGTGGEVDLRQRSWSWNWYLLEEELISA